MGRRIPRPASLIRILLVLLQGFFSGSEIALACHYRIADGGARLGFPEINLGIVPGAGGTQRLPRVVGVQNALQMFLSGRPVGATDALAMGLVDAIADGDLAAFAIDFAESCIAEGRGPKRSCDVDIERDAAVDELLESERQRVAATMPGRVVPGMVIDAVEAAIDLPFDEGIKREVEISDASLETVESGAMRRLFFAERATSKIPGIDADSARDIASAGIIGGGTMGRGISMAFANAGLPVTTAKGLSHQGLVKAFPSRHLGRQEHSARFLVTMPNLVHHFLTGLGCQLATAPRTVLSAEFAV